MISELHEWCRGFISRSAEWRRSSFEDDWRRWQRNSDSIYDPALSKKKEDWQSKAFWPITASHRENAQGQLFKTEVGPRPPLEVKVRPGLGGEQDQAGIIRDLILREREKSRYEIHRNGIIEDKTTYGSGFAEIFFETLIEDRQIVEPIFQPVAPDDPASIQASMSGQLPIIGYSKIVKPQVIYRGVRLHHVSIWDVFPDPQSLRIQGSPIAIRYPITYGEIVAGSKPQADGSPGYALPEAAAKMRDVASEEVTPIDKSVVESDRNIVNVRIMRPNYAKIFQCYKLFARLPKKWVLIDGQEIDDPEELIPAEIRFTDQAVISVQLNENYDGEPPIYKDDYLPVALRFYARGIPEMLKDVQSVTNETINQRLDNGALTLKNFFAVIEKAVVDPKDFNIGNGSAIRFKAQDGISDVDQLFKKVDLGGMDRAAFIESQEWERAAQERTSINRQTLGTQGQVRDSNQTLGGQQLLLQATGEKLAFIGMLSEFDFQYDITRAYWKLIYQNYQPEDVAMAIGPERAATFIPMSPEQVENAYQYYPMGIFTQENKAQRQARLAQWDQQFGMMPWADRLQVARAELQSMDEEPEKFIIPEADAVQIIGKAQEMAQGMVQQLAPDGKNPEGMPAGGMREGQG